MLHATIPHVMLDLGIIIVNWNTRDYLRSCLQTVYASQGDFSFRVVVVDNDSTDGSPAMVAEEFPQAVLLSGHGNVGYPAGNNLGLAALGYPDDPEAPRYALLLNSDTELPPNALARMLAFMDSRPGAGIAGPKLILRDGSLDLACRRSIPEPDIAIFHVLKLDRLFPKSRRFARYNLTFLDEDETAEVGSVVGAFMMVRREAIARVGLMDERFFMYGEDLDWAKRIGEAGWRIYYYPEVRVLHVKRAASSQSQRAQFEFVRASLLFYNKHYRGQTPWPLHVAILLGFAVQGGPRLWPEVIRP
jgi:N-acetylglucosaminyl-diphospho-decaprenol L-rhamnosyltransferase